MAAARLCLAAAFLGLWAVSCRAAAAAGPVQRAEAAGGAAASCVGRALRDAGDCAVAYGPGTPEYAAAVDIDNKRVASRPAAVVEVTNTTGVALTVSAARSCNLSLSVRGGGHGAEGFALAGGGVALSTARLNGTALEALGSTMRVGTGARWSDVYAAVWPGDTGLVPIGGGCPQVGVAGFLMGGGWSFLSRSYGLACDNWEGATMVLANGSVVELGPSSTGALADLWWAVRGGGGGNFGVVTEVVIRLRRPERVMSVGEMCWPEAAPEVRPILLGWVANFSSMPRWLDTVPVWLPAGPGGRRVFCVSVFCNNGEAECAGQLAWLAALKPDIDTVARQPFLEWQTGKNDNVTDAQGGFLDLRSFVVQEDWMGEAVVDLMIGAVARSPSPRDLVLMHVGGGAIADVKPADTAFVHRDAMVVLQYKAIWEDARDEGASRSWLADEARRLRPYTSGAYVNYISTETPDWHKAYYGANYARLLEIKTSADPDNFFRFNMSIGAPNNPDRPAVGGGNGFRLDVAVGLGVVGAAILILLVTTARQSRKLNRSEAGPAEAVDEGAGYQALSDH